MFLFFYSKNVMFLFLGLGLLKQNTYPFENIQGLFICGASLVKNGENSSNSMH
jgi:hypothetical protein